MGLVQEFKTFVQRGNVVDMAVGIIIGGAFGKIVSSLVADVLGPPIGYLMSGVDFKAMSIKLLPPMLGDKPPVPVEIKYGSFLQATSDFLITAFCIFLLIKVMNQLKKKEEAAPAAPPEPSAQEKLLTEIRDLLKARA